MSNTITAFRQSTSKDNNLHSIYLISLHEIVMRFRNPKRHFGFRNEIPIFEPQPKHSFCAAILVLTQGAELPRNGAYSPYVSTEDSETNAEMAQKSTQKNARDNSLTAVSMLFISVRYNCISQSISGSRAVFSRCEGIPSRRVLTLSRKCCFAQGRGLRQG